MKPMNIQKSSMAAALFCFITASSSFGQATFGFFNYVDGVLDAPVFDSNGLRLNGTDYVTMLYGGPTVDSLIPAYAGSQIMAPVPFTYRPDLGGGYFARGGAVEIDTVPGGGMAWLQVRAWDARLGATYEDVVALGIGGYGESGLFQKQGGNPDLGVPTPSEPLIGLQSFSLLEMIPEPNTFALVLLGFGLLFRRRHQR